MCKAARKHFVSLQWLPYGLTPEDCPSVSDLGCDSACSTIHAGVLCKPSKPACQGGLDGWHKAGTREVKPRYVSIFLVLTRGPSEFSELYWKLCALLISCIQEPIRKWVFVEEGVSVQGQPCRGARGKDVYIETYGCQMNSSDTEVNTACYRLRHPHTSTKVSIYKFVAASFCFGMGPCAYCMRASTTIA